MARYSVRDAGKWFKKVGTVKAPTFKAAASLAQKRYGKKRILFLFEKR
jgi:hypothetical protein